MNEKIKLLDSVDKFLQSEKGYKKSWIRSFLGILLCSIMFAVILAISYNYGPLSGKQVNFNERCYATTLALPSNASLLENATYMAIAGFCIMGFPFVCSLAIWMIGINQVLKSKYYHLFLWFMILVAFLLAVIAVIFLIRASIFNYNEFPVSKE